MTILELYRERARSRGLPDEVVGRALRLARPRIELRSPDDSMRSESDPVMGRYGGSPWLPPDVAWDGYPHFVASVDCAALPPDALDIPLPKDGRLLFFASKEYWAGGSMPGDEDRRGRVVHVPAGVETAERTPAEKHAEYLCEPFPLYGRVEAHVPNSEDDVVLSSPENERLYDEYDLSDFDGLGGVGELTLGGYSCPVHEDPCGYRWPEDDGEARVLLAQAEYPNPEDPDMVLVVYWMIRRKDLADKEFGDIKLVTQAWH
ncbi:DUF1963 domain-containing protein [Actinacidiphila acididurans]|uniref:DUF1963 domain-containing protein n=1 Tax=Actinacidiphila acididurans TaxID=2784346 RepID=A0ABS2TX83_9ACTN|nr:DUF1963 domain-containing protein [Actinacidiphila acididurans]MBM9506870.1 DUF1963 domain-containing protein [Actinacidiphila acididurans]